MFANQIPKGYSSYIKQHPLLSVEEETNFFSEIQLLNSKKNEATAKEQSMILHKLNELRHNIISSNLRLVLSIARQYLNRGLAFDDLINEGTVGLIEAVNRFDVKKGFRFSTYASCWIKQAIIKSLGNNTNSFRLPTYILNIVGRYSLAHSILAQELGRDPHIHEIAKYLAIPLAKLQEIVTISKGSCSIDMPNSEENSGPLTDALIDTRTCNQNDGPVIHSIRVHVIDKLLSGLTEKEQKVVKLRFGIDNNTALTLEETCRELKITRERVRQIQNSAILKLRCISKEYGVQI